MLTSLLPWSLEFRVWSSGELCSGVLACRNHGWFNLLKCIQEELARRV